MLTFSTQKSPRRGVLPGLAIAGVVLATHVLPLAPVASQEVPADAALPSQPAPLFMSDDVLTFTIRAPLRTITRDRRQDSEEHPGSLILTQPDCARLTLDVQFRTRGNSRLRPNICNFPPLRLNFRRSQVENTVFEGQDRIKLVTHCQDRRDEYEQYLLHENVIYQAYNLFTERSFRVRLARITYEDTDGDRDTLTKYAFFIEPDEQVATRNGWEVLHVRSVNPSFFDPQPMNVLDVFQYMIGNVDWSAFAYERGKDECCHNTVPIGSVSGPVYSVPHDFDTSGIIMTRYANRLFGPRERLGIPTFRRRLYWGLCYFQPDLPVSYEVFKEKKEAIYNLYRHHQYLDPALVERTLAYLDEFYGVINDPDKANREMARECREL